MSEIKQKPTIEELEKILANNEKAEIRISPDGSVFVSREIDRLTTENQSLRTQLAEKEAEAAVMREALRELKVRIAYIGMPQEPYWNANGTMVPDWRNHIAILENALHNTSAGKAYLARMEEARWLLEKATTVWPNPKWAQRRDTLLEQLKGGA